MGNVCCATKSKISHDGEPNPKIMQLEKLQKELEEKDTKLKKLQQDLQKRDTDLAARESQFQIKQGEFEQKKQNLQAVLEIAAETARNRRSRLWRRECIDTYSNHQYSILHKAALEISANA